MTADAWASRFGLVSTVMDRRYKRRRAFQVALGYWEKEAYKPFMPPFLIFSVISAVVFLGAALPSHAQNQNEMNQQASADFEKADKELNQVYQKVLKSFDDDMSRKKFVDAQKAWLKFRDAQGAFASDEMRGGSAEPLLLYGSYLTTTQARIVQLKKYLTDSTGK